MALRHAILATLLTEGDASGYDLAKRFDPEHANFWVATPQQLYRELERMAADGVVAARTVEQEKRPNKRVFRITDAGRAALAGLGDTPARPTAIRDELLVAVQAIEVGDRDRVCAAIRDRRARAEDKLAHYRRAERRLRTGRTEDELLATTELVGPYLTLLRGLSFERENIAWCDTALRALTTGNDVR